jgi:hypothetical protein
VTHGSLSILATVSSDQWFSLLTPVMVIIAVIMQRWADHKASKRDKEAKVDRREVKEKVAEVKTELKDNTATTKTIHKQLNGERSLMLNTIASDKRRIAELTKKKEDVAIADAAESVARDHDAKQADV